MGLCIWHDRQAAWTKAVLEMQVGSTMGHMPLADHGTVSWALSRFTVAQPFLWISLTYGSSGGSGRDRGADWREIH